MPFEEKVEINNKVTNIEKKSSKEERLNEKIIVLMNMKKELEGEYEKIRIQLEEKYIEYQELIEEGAEKEKIEKLEYKTEIIMNNLTEVEEKIESINNEINEISKKIKQQEKSKEIKTSRNAPIIFVDDIGEEDIGIEDINNTTNTKGSIVEIDLNSIGNEIEEELRAEIETKLSMEQENKVETISLKEELKNCIIEIEELFSIYVDCLYRLEDDFPMYARDYSRLEYSFVSIPFSKKLEELLIKVKNISLIVNVYSYFDKSYNGGNINNLKEPIYIRGICNYIMKRIISNIIFLSNGSIIPLLQRIESYLLTIESYIDKLNIEEIRSDMLLSHIKDYDFIWNYKMVKTVFSGNIEFETDDIMKFLIYLFRLRGELNIISNNELIKKLSLRKPELMISVSAFFDRFEVLHKLLLRSQFSGHYIDFFHLTNEMIIILNELEQLLLLTKIPFNEKIRNEVDIEDSILGALSIFLEKNDVKGTVYVFTKLDKTIDPVTGETSHPCAYCEKLESSGDFQDFILWFNNPKVKKMLQIQKVNTQTDNGLMFAESCYCKNIPIMLSGLNLYQGIKGSITINELKDLVNGNFEYIKYEHGKREKTKGRFVDAIYLDKQLGYLLGYIPLKKYGILRNILTEERLIEQFLMDGVNPAEFLIERLSKENIENKIEEEVVVPNIDIGIRGERIIDITELQEKIVEENTQMYIT